MTVVRAAIRGLMRMMESSVLVLLLWVVVLLGALPLAVVMEEAIRTDVGASLIQADLRRGLDLGWLEEFQHRRGGLATTLDPSRVSSAMFLDNSELWLNGDWLIGHRALAAAGVLFLAVWILLQGGLLNHLSRRGDRFHLGTFLAACGEYFFRFLRLSLLMGLCYYGVYRFGRWLFPSIEQWTRDVTVERTALTYNLVGALGVVLLMVFVHLVSDYAKIAIVREQRRSTLLAVLRSLWQIVRHPIQAVGLYWVMSATLLGVQIVYFLVAPGPARAGWLAVAVAFIVGQIYLLARWSLRVARYGAEIELFDQWTGRLAGDRARLGQRS